MKFSLRSCDLVFEINDAWWFEGGMADFIPVMDAYVYDRASSARLEKLCAIRPPLRVGAKVAFRSKDALVSIFSAIAQERPLPAIEVKKAEGDAPYEYEVHDGFHRFYASVAAGFSEIPVQDFVDIAEFLRREERNDL